ncbi:hypothetical protein LOTGIDRAFT_163106 [Lottia gigantea]|uniref:CCHC-type domain-containing protein n=1 Tax=Lottia gigantea TaxID=225164 RepID=V4BS55_LOTGI|nr:hypothetical protein LOTGIDRAFT_163106 [Lottia gigantea]ESO91744.1 hypothetical protein LOTGIDRAFT_163106 [Lottia gigantea]
MEKQGIQKRTLVFNQSSGNQFVYGHDFVTFLRQNGIDPKSIVSMGSGRSARSFHVTFESEETVSSILEKHPVAEIGTNSYSLSGGDKSKLIARLFWLPEYISDHDIANFFKAFNLKVVSVSREFFSNEGLKHIRTLTRRVLLEGKPGGFDSLPHTSSVCGKDVLIILQGRAPICLKCFQPGHMRKECPFSKTSSVASVSSYASALSKAPPSRNFVPASSLVKSIPPPPPPPPPTTVKLYEKRVDEDGFFTPRHNAKKRTSSECHTLLVDDSNNVSAPDNRSKKVALQKPTKGKKVSGNTYHSQMLQSAAAGANTPPASTSSSKLSDSSSSKPEKKTKNVSDVSGEMTSVELPQVDMELEDMAADTERLNSVLGSLTPGGSSNGEGMVSEGEFSDEDSLT